METSKRSHPLWARGLKRENKLGKLMYYLSHPLWVRGLKPASENIY